MPSRAVTDDHTAQFFSEGCRPETLGDFQWSLDEPERLSSWEPVELGHQSHFAPYATGVERGGRGL